MTRPRRQTEQLVGPWRSKPLKRDRQAFAVKVLSLRIGRKPVDRNPRGARRIRHWNAFTVHGAKPTIWRPHHRLNRGFAAESTATAILQRAAAEIDHVGFACRGLDEIRMSGTLQRKVRPMTGA